MITPSYSATATERVLPRMALDFTTGVLDPRVTVTRALNTATRVNASGFIEIVNADLPRFDYSPVTLAPRGLLIEESRTNALTYSNDFNNVIWTKTNCSITLAGTSPDGTANTNVLVENSASGNHWFFTANAVVGSYTLSVYAKPDTRNWLVMRVTLGTGNAIAFFNVSTGVVGTLAAGLTATITPAGNGFYRCSISGTLVVGAVVIGAASADGVASYAGNSGNALGLYGAQLEAGAFATSYIPTTATSLTRNNDIVSMTGTNFSDWYNASGGSFVFEGSAVRPLGFAYLVLASDNTNTNRFGAYKSGAAVSGFVASSSGTQMEITGSSIVANVPFKTAVAAQANSGNFSFNGSIGTNDTAIVMPTVNQLTIGSFQNLSPLNGHARAVRYYLPRLTNAELQAFST